MPGKINVRAGELLAKPAHNYRVALRETERRLALIDNTAAVIDTDGEVDRQISQDDFRDDRYYHENFYFAAGACGFRAWASTVRQASVSACCGTNGTPRQRDLTASARCRDYILSHNWAIGLHPGEEKPFGKAHIPRGKRSSVVMRSRTAVILQRRSCRSRSAAGGDGIEFWAKLRPDRTARSSREVRSTKKKIVIADVDGMHKRAADALAILRDRRIDGRRNRRVDDRLQFHSIRNAVQNHTRRSAHDLRGARLRKCAPCRISACCANTRAMTSTA